MAIIGLYLTTSPNPARSLKVLRRVAKKEARRRAKVLRLQQSKVLHRALKNYSLVLRVSLRRLLMN